MFWRDLASHTQAMFPFIPEEFAGTRQCVKLEYFFYLKKTEKWNQVSNPSLQFDLLRRIRKSVVMALAG